MEGWVEEGTNGRNGWKEGWVEGMGWDGFIGGWVDRWMDGRDH